MYVIIDLVTEYSFVATDAGAVAKVLNKTRDQVRGWFRDGHNVKYLDDLIIAKGARRVKSNRNFRYG